MSISYCSWCERIVERNTQTETDEYGAPYEICKDCGEEITELFEDPPDPALDKFRQIADQVGDK